MSSSRRMFAWQVGKRGTTINKFCKRKVSKQVLNVRKDLTKLLMEDLQLTGQGKLYINQSLCPYYKVLWSKSKSRHRIGKRFSYYVSSGTVKSIIQETSQPLSIMHTNDLNKIFPDVDLGRTVWRWDIYHQRGIWGLCSVCDGPLCDNIYQEEAVRYCHRELSLKRSGYVDSWPLYSKTYVMFQFSTSSCCLLLTTSHLFSVSK